MILPIFSLSGNIPVVRHWFIINVNDGVSSFLIIFSRAGEIPSYS